VVGLTPRYIRETQRVNEIQAAMKRYTEAGLEIPPEWIEELQDLASKDAADRCGAKAVLGEVGETISESFYDRNQTRCYDWVVQFGRNKFKVEIRRNAYDFQSYRRGYVFDSTKWNLVVDHPITGAACAVVSYVDRSPDKRLFVQDAQAMVKELRLIVG
jgi:hypothetical protein